MGSVSILQKINRQHFITILDAGNGEILKPFQKELDKSRLEELQIIITLVNEIGISLETLKADIFNMRNLKIDVDSVRKKLLEIQEKIHQTKDRIKQKLMVILEEQHKITNDLKQFKKHMQDWVKPIGTKVQKLEKISNIYGIQKYHAKFEIDEFQKFLSESGGHYGRWPEQDHLLFMRERKKNKKQDFLTIVHDFLPHLTYEEIEKHEKWYLKYETLRGAQKEAIQKWKEQKLKESENKLKNDKVQENKEIISKANKKDAHQVDIAERIKEWKKKQQAKKLEEIEKQAQEKKQVQLERKNMNRINQLKKQALSQYKIEKIQKMQKKLIQQNQKQFPINKTKKNILLKSFQLQDTKFIERKKKIRLQLEAKATSKSEYLNLAKSPLDFLLPRDPQRIFRPTLIWIQHCQPDKNEKEKLNVFNLNTIPRLAVPEWRRGLKFN